MGKRIKRIAKTTSLTALLLTMGLFTAGTVAGMESNLLPLYNEKITNTSFKSYLAKAKSQIEGENLAYIAAVITYPGARLGTTIHNSNVSK